MKSLLSMKGNNCYRKHQYAKVMKQIMFRLLVSFSVGTATALLLVPIAYEERGYLAVGGEWFGTVFVIYSTFMLTKYLFKEREEDE